MAFDSKKIKVKLNEEEVLDSSIEKEIMEELGLSNEPTEDITEELDLDDINVSDDLTDDDLLESELEIEDDFLEEEDELEIDLEDDLSDDDLEIDLEDDFLEEEEIEDELELTEDDLTDDDLLENEDELELTEDDLTDDDLLENEDLYLESEEIELTESEIDAKIASLEEKKNKLKNEGAKMVPEKVLSETKKALKKMGIDFIKIKEENSRLRNKVIKLVKENQNISLDNSKAEAVITLFTKNEIPTTAKVKIMESIDLSKTINEVKLKFNKYNNLLKENSKKQTLNRLTESSKVGKTTQLSAKQRYQLGIDDDYLSVDNYMKDK